MNEEFAFALEMGMEINVACSELVWLKHSIL
jgi:hypothetical protein